MLTKSNALDGATQPDCSVEPEVLLCALQIVFERSASHAATYVLPELSSFLQRVADSPPSSFKSPAHLRAAGNGGIGPLGGADGVAPDEVAARFAVLMHWLGVGTCLHALPVLASSQQQSAVGARPGSPAPRDAGSPLELGPLLLRLLDLQAQSLDQYEALFSFTLLTLQQLLLSQSEKSREALRKRVRQQLASCRFTEAHYRRVQLLFPSLLPRELCVVGFVAPGVESDSSRPRGEQLDAWLMLEDELHLNMNPSMLMPPPPPAKSE